MWTSRGDKQKSKKDRHRPKRQSSKDEDKDKRRIVTGQGTKSQREKQNSSEESQLDTSQWNEWEWHEEIQSEYRSRQKPDGVWEYEYRQSLAEDSLEEDEDEGYAFQPRSNSQQQTQRRGVQYNSENVPFQEGEFEDNTRQSIAPAQLVQPDSQYDPTGDPPPQSRNNIGYYPISDTTALSRSTVGHSRSSRPILANTLRSTEHSLGRFAISEDNNDENGYADNVTPAYSDNAEIELKAVSRSEPKTEARRRQSATSTTKGSSRLTKDSPSSQKHSSSRKIRDSRLPRFTDDPSVVPDLQKRIPESSFEYTVKQEPEVARYSQPIDSDLYAAPPAIYPAQLYGDRESKQGTTEDDRYSEDDDDRAAPWKKLEVIKGYKDKKWNKEEGGLQDTDRRNTNEKAHTGS